MQILEGTYPVEEGGSLGPRSMMNEGTAAIDADASLTRQLAHTARFVKATCRSQKILVHDRRDSHAAFLGFVAGDAAGGVAVTFRASPEIWESAD